MRVRASFICFQLFLVGLNCSLVAASPVYVYREPDGVVRFTTKQPPVGVEAKVFRARQAGYSRVWTAGGGKGVLFADRYRGIVETAAQRYQISPHLVRAVIHAESAFNPNAVSPKGALGLMQLMPANVRRFGVGNPFSPQQNILAGTKLLAMLQNKYRGRPDLALAAYNAGEQAVARHGGVPPYPETKQYVQRVMKLWRRYEQELS